MTIDEMLAEARRRLRRLEPQAAADAMRSGSVLIDVRTGEQRARDGTVPGAVPIALNVLEWRATARADQEVSVMFVQVIQGKVNDSTALRERFEQWDQQLKPGASGFLGSTAGVTADGEFIALVRFESEAAARANSERTEQDAWWRETSRYLDEPMFHDCTLVDLVNDGGSDDAGFVQVIQGKVTDVDKARELDRAMQQELGSLRPDVIGGIVAWHPRDGRFTNAMYFTSEAEAREKERETSDAREFEDYMRSYRAISDGEPKYLDLTDPWYTST